MKKLLSILCVCLSVPVFGQMKADDVQTFTLDNGMKFLVIEDGSIPNANMYLFYKVGSRNEHPGITGLSHFFEHMMFNGAEKYGPKEFDRVMEYNGGANNAYTTQDVTVYTNWFPNSALEVIFDLEADRIGSLSIDSAMVESERGVVLSERSTGLENSPWRVLGEAVNSTAFLEHSYNWSVIGYESDIKNWKKEDLEEYFNTYYDPSNCVIVISGDVKFDEVKQLAESYMAPIPSTRQPKPVHLVEPPQTGERRITVQKEVSSPYMIVGYHTPNTQHGDYYALDILSSILSRGKTSRLYSALVDQKQLATGVFTNFGESFDPNLFSVYAVAAREVDEADLEKAIYEEIEKVKAEGIKEDELQKIKNQKLMDFYSQIETINGKSNNIGTYELFFGDYRKMFDAPEEYEKVTMDDIQRVANEYFKKSNRTVGVLKANVEE
ncbi:insulinase family protein [Litoribacter alkaliphilus]|uniref:Insulinase family protein n=1 Tax=Litoribacter ruber TaxID=702568 RepID=A0AAP2CIM6_9BACT|nr:pitrilysin family protein [Litoribacter alkaliphilus]MBS9524545.1 insulinase family protein [Litoribacter alkaliphilus]